MKIKVRNRIIDPNKEPVALIFDDEDDKNQVVQHLQSMSYGFTKYMIYPSSMDEKTATHWLHTEPDEQDAFLVPTFDIKLFQTETSKKKGMWHILDKITKTHAEPLCGAMGYWFGGYHNDKPEQTRENLGIVNFDGSQKICKSCVMAAYDKGLIRLVMAK